jgi:heat shock protein HslJ
MPKSTSRSRLVAGLLLGAVALGACSPAATPAPTATPVASTGTGTGTEALQLAGTSWLLVGYTSPVNGANFTVPMSITPTLVFGDGTANGNAGCNTFSGSWSLEGDVLEFTGPVTSTEVACENPGKTIEAAYLANLALVDRVQMRGENLFMYQADGLTELEFMPAGT